MPYRIKLPDPDTLLGRHESGAELYAELAPVPLYVHARILAPGLLGTKRASFRAGWVIEERRWARGQDASIIPAHLLAWAATLVQEAYPSVEEAAGLTRVEIDALKAEQAAKRAAHERRKS